MANELIVPLEEYLKAGIHIGTKFATKDMTNFIFKKREDGVYIMNAEKCDERLNIAKNMLCFYDTEEILVACRRENGWLAVELFSKLTGIKTCTKRYSPGLLTNISLKNFKEPKLILAVDPFPDKNAVNDAFKLGIPVIALCDTNNDTKGVDLVVPCNNKGKKSLGLMFFIFTRAFLIKQGLLTKPEEFKYKIEDFAQE